MTDAPAFADGLGNYQNYRNFDDFPLCNGTTTKTMSLLRWNREKSLPSAGESSKQTKRRRVIDWQLTPDPVDGPMRQGTKNEKIKQDAQLRPLMVPSDLCTLIKENFNAYIRSLPPHPTRHYTGTADVVTGVTTDDRRFARLEVQKAASSELPANSFVLAIAIARHPIRALDGLYFVTTKLFVQEPLHHNPQVSIEYDEDDADGATIHGDEGSEREGLKG